VLFRMRSTFRGRSVPTRADGPHDTRIDLRTRFCGPSAVLRRRPMGTAHLGLGSGTTMGEPYGSTNRSEPDCQGQPKALIYKEFLRIRVPFVALAGDPCSDQHQQ
jgi:hypothetical protein